MSTPTGIDARVILDSIENWFEGQRTDGLMPFVDCHTNAWQEGRLDIHRGLPRQLLIRVDGVPFRITVTEGE
jgi:hypothetical protein